MSWRKSKKIYSDHEKDGNINLKVQEHLIENNTIFELKLISDWNNPYAHNVILRRNLKSDKKNIVRTINGELFYSENKYIEKLKEILFPNVGERPSFNQLIAHNIRYEDLRTANAINYLQNISAPDHEALFLYFLGLKTENAQRREAIRKEIQAEEKFISKLLGKRNYNDLEILQENILREIEIGENQLKEINLPEDFYEKVNEFDKVTVNLESNKALASNNKLRMDLTVKRIEELNNQSMDSLDEVRSIYEEASILLNDSLHKKYEELVAFYNNIIKGQLDVLYTQKNQYTLQYESFSKEVKELSRRRADLYSLIQSKEFANEYQTRVDHLNTYYEEKGAIEQQMNAYLQSKNTIDNLTKEEKNISEAIYTEEYQMKLKKRIDIFNKEYYSNTSRNLYNATYVLTCSYDYVGRNPYKTYSFNSIGGAFSTGEKQVEVLAFDLATTLYAKDHNIAILPFLLNDKKELLSSKQINKAIDIISSHEIQLVFSILKEKKDTLKGADNYVVLELKDDDKLFRIESGKYDSLLNL